jgi:hypothetical protein
MKTDSCIELRSRLAKAVTSADTVGDEDGGEEAKISKELRDAKAAIAQRRPFAA